ncbi:MAG: response regulator [Ardenticatenales bacterium]|nr:response regulator [Ardenticatenales bacterium]
MIDPKEAIVLVVEDNADNMFITIELLYRKVGVRYADGVATGVGLLRWVSEKPDSIPHLILLDIQIPGEDGHKVLRRVRDHPKLTATRVAALTSNVMPTDVDKAHLSGFDGFIGKPLEFTRFPDQIRRLLNGEAVWEPS